MKKFEHVLQAYCDQALFDICEELAKEKYLSNSSFLKTLIARAWQERKGGGAVQVTEIPVEKLVGVGRATKSDVRNHMAEEEEKVLKDNGVFQALPKNHKSLRNRH